MPAISKVLTVIADTQIDPDSPIDTALMTSIRDNLIFLKEWIGASYAATAVQDHNHDGVNSALVPIGPNYLRNGSFEDGTAGWTSTAYTGGTVATNAANNMDGATALAITSTVLANGGGDVASDGFTAITGGVQRAITGAVKASVVNVSSKVEALWYDAAKALISATTVYSSASTPTAQWQIGDTVSAPATARFMKIKLTGGVPATGTAVGTIYFDGFVGTLGGRRLVKFTTITASNAIWAKLPETTLIVVQCTGGGGGGAGSWGDGTNYSTDAAPGGGGRPILGFISNPSAALNAVVGAGGAAGAANSVAVALGAAGGTTSFGGVAASTGGRGGDGSTGTLATSMRFGTLGGGDGGVSFINGGTSGTAGSAGVIYVWEYI